jgi:hypothetical protein
MITEINIWRAANLLIRRHDENAELELRISPPVETHDRGRSGVTGC